MLGIKWTVRIIHINASTGLLPSGCVIDFRARAHGIAHLSGAPQSGEAPREPPALNGIGGMVPSHTCSIAMMRVRVKGMVACKPVDRE